ncbi:MAG: S-methyl-5'-thioadenosine phosphorylase [Candidatus Brocadiaceae bacterium]|nr:S-methyl-5'-thioadenosine phosphorylase [Candidatus Brocadiaceae bacterium]
MERLDEAIGVIGGSGLCGMEGLEPIEEVEVATPFGAPSDHYIVGKIEGRLVVFLARHGRTHRLLPHELNYRANLFGFKKLGVQRIVSVSAVGSLKEDIHPLHIVVPDQFFDRTRHRADTFFGDGVVVHVGFGDPVCPQLHGALCHAAAASGATVWPGGTYVCMEGPAFSTRAESQVYRSWGASVIGMTNLPEAKLAREAEMCYATLALVTDFDCWHEAEEAVTQQDVLQNMQANVATAQRTLRALVASLGRERSCACGDALRSAFARPPGQAPAAARERLDIIIGKYLQ